MSAGNLRASDADRDRVAEILHTAYAEGRITSDEHSERLSATNAAKTFDELLPLTADLVPTGSRPDLFPSLPPSPVPRPNPGSGAMSSPASRDQPDRIRAALSEVKRQGPWRVRRRNFAHVFMGSIQLDLTEAVFDAQEIEVNITQVLGSISFRVPAGTTVRDETANVLGETTIKGIGDPNPDYPVLVLRGTNVLGEIKVRGPKRPTVWRRALT